MYGQEQVFVYQQVSLHYSLTGKGKKVLLAFHGYGQTKLHFRHIAKQLSGQYTLYTFDLFFHGKSIWPFKDNPLTKNFLAGMMSAFLEKEKINQFSLMGFSMGGKMVLSLLEQFPDRVEQLILIAPDGIKTSFWYSLATYPGWTKQYFRSLVISPYAFKKPSFYLPKITAGRQRNCTICPPADGYQAEAFTGLLFVDGVPET